MQLQLPKVYDHVTHTYRKSISIKTTPTEGLLPCNYSYPKSMTMFPHLQEVYFYKNYTYKRTITIKNIVTEVPLS
jgi:hypothetical protein